MNIVALAPYNLPASTGHTTAAQARLEVNNQTASAQPHTTQAQTPDTLPLSRPQPVDRHTLIEPASSSDAWSSTLNNTLDHLPSTRGWQAISLGLGQLSRRGETIQQSAKTQLMPRTKSAASAEIISQSSLGKMSFSATLASGTKVSFTVDARAGLERSGQTQTAFRAVDVSFAVAGELSEQKQTELDALSEQLGAFVGHFASHGEPDLSQLALSEFTTIETLRLNVKTADKQSLSLAYTRDAQTTTLNMGWNGRSLDLTVAQGVTGEQELARLRTTLLDQLDKAHAERSDTQALVQALSLFGATATKPATRADDTEGLLTGLPDYQLSFKGVVDYPMARTEHHDKFSGIQLLSISQNTHTEQRNGITVIEQTQSVNLEAGYFTALTHLEDADFERENFKWNHISESHEIVSQQTWQDDWLTHATVQRSANIHNMQQTWSEGELVDKWRDERRDFSTLDVRDLLNTANQHTDLLAQRQSEEKLKALINPVH